MTSQNQLQDDALRLVKLDQQVVQAITEKGNLEEFYRSLSEYAELRKSLKIRLLNRNAVAVNDPEAANIILKISHDERWLESDLYIEQLSANIGEKIPLGEVKPYELDELASELFYSWISGTDYVKTLLQLRPLVLRSPASKIVARLVGEVKDCYALQQYDATYAMCRTLLEASVRDIIEKRELMPEFEKNVLHAFPPKIPWHKMREAVSSGPLSDQLGELYEKLCVVLHARKSATAEEALPIFRETLDIIEKLYEKHKI